MITANCWFCKRTPPEEEIYLHSDEMEKIFKEVFDQLPIKQNFTNFCVCTICMALMKFTAQDTVAARIKLGHAGDAIKEKATIFSTKFKEAASDLKKKADEIREEERRKSEHS
jgi:hypothetical protein